MKNAVKEYPVLKDFFDFPEFNPIQKHCLAKIMKSQGNMIVSAPTSSGKTVIFQMAILKYSQYPSPICLYLAPIKSLCHEKYTSWNAKFSRNLKVTQVTGDTLENGQQKALQSHIAVATPQKIDFLSRQNLNYLKKIKLLLIDQIHMLNYEERGATLQAIVSRIMSLNDQVRIIAVSATIPNIHQVGQWLRCSPQNICIFGEEYRPVKIKTVVAGLAHSGNPFTFQRTLNYKLLETIRSYSNHKGTLVFCPTQKGTQQACEHILTQIRQRQFIDNDKQLLSLVNSVKQISNNQLQVMIPQGVAFHNASLSYQDRTTVQKLFLQLKIKVLCTTSTLSMGINLPARLVIIKSTQCYRGSVKGYQEYTRIEIEQMMGRAGRPPFDTQGTVVIMTQKSNYNRYNTKLQLQNLQSQLFNHMLQHINAQVSLGSILSLSDIQSYFFNSFCYIRMKQSPKTYNVTGRIQDFIRKSCYKAVKKLSDLSIINFSEDSQRVSPRPLSISISKNAVQIRSISFIRDEMANMQNSKDYLQTLCKCQQIGKYTSRIEQRKFLKQLNQKSRYPLKEAISNAERKAFVLIQAELSRFHIEYWQMRRQASEILALLKRLNNCIKTLAFQMKNFWLYYWALSYQKYFQLKFWEHADNFMKLQVSGLNKKSKSAFENNPYNMNTLQQAIQMKHWLQKDTINQHTQNEHYSNSLHFKLQKDEISSNLILVVTAVYDFTSVFKGVTVCVGDSKNYLYNYKYINQNKKQIEVHFPKNSSEEYKIGIIKEGIVGFDQFYKLRGDKLTKFTLQQLDLKVNSHNRKSLENIKRQPELSFEKKRNSSHQIQTAPQDKKRQGREKGPTVKKRNDFIDNMSRDSRNDMQMTVPVVHKPKKETQLLLPQKYRIRKSIQGSDSENDGQNRRQKSIQVGGSRFKDLKSYNWKPGFEEIKSEQSSQKDERPRLKLVSSKDKSEPFHFSQFACKDTQNQKGQKKQIQCKSRKKQQGQIKSNQPDDVFSYFYNLF